MLTIKSCDTLFHTQRLLLDELDRPIAKLRSKNMTAHARWNVFEGDSEDNSDMIFSATTKHMIQNYTHVNVSLANKMSRSDDCDFQMKGSWSNRDCTIYKGDSSTTVIAKMQQIQSPEKFMLTINPNVDYAFVVALIPIVDAMKSHGAMKVVAAHVAAHAALGVVETALECIADVILSS
ncbi:hypothetical protein QVD17_06250 [Tagetes erecta]|uniref:Uncharacterized protein n=1 Tax=Tagetes erecta TaxID=13708 RepID=A0AAD8LJ11_TARER|nr:hypothetical protein QVD17_06250 [Tagetes erecta]